MQGVREEGPGKNSQPGPLRDSRHSVEELRSVRAVSENWAAFESSNHHVMQGAQRIQARAAWHAEDLTREGGSYQLKVK